MGVDLAPSPAPFQNNNPITNGLQMARLRLREIKRIYRLEFFMQFKQLFTGPAGVALSCAVAPASAAITFTDIQYSPTEFGGGIRVQSLGFANYGPTGQFLAQGYDTIPDNIVRFISFCIDVTKPFRAPSEFQIQTLESLFPDAVKRNQLAAMLINGEREIRTASSELAARKAAAAVGIGIWEIIYEPTSTGYDVVDGSGNFSVYGDFDPYAGLANSYLANVTSGAWTGDANRLKTLVSVNGEYQNQVFISSPVPEPSTWAQLMFGLAIVGAAMRRRRKKSVFA